MTDDSSRGQYDLTDFKIINIVVGYWASAHEKWTPTMFLANTKKDNYVQDYNQFKTPFNKLKIYNQVCYLKENDSFFFVAFRMNHAQTF